MGKSDNSFRPMRKILTKRNYSLGTGTSIEITGLWQPAPIGKEQKNELKVENIRILGRADAEVRCYTYSDR